MLDPITELILIKENRNQVHLNEFGLLTWLAAAGVAAYVAPKVSAFLRQHNQLKRRCSKLTGEQKDDCIDSIKSGFNHNSLNILRQAKMQCPKTSDPEKCNTELDDRMRMFNY